MRAILCESYGPPESLNLREVPDLRAEPGKVVVRVHAAGVNFPDTLIIQGKYQFQPPMPFSPGSEVAGVIEQIGDGVEGWSVGDTVIAFTGWGAFAEQVVAEPGQLVRVPDGLDLTLAASFILTYATSYHALKDRASLQAGETLLVLGAAGGVGLAAVELGKMLGARVIAAASSKEKLAVCAEHGADELIDYTTEDLRARLKDLTGGKGVDVVYDPVGGDFAEPALRSIAWKGRFLVVGFAAGDIPKIPLNLTLLKGCQIVGVFWGAFAARERSRSEANNAELLAMLQAGTLKPLVSKTYPLEQTAIALDDMLARKVTGKVVITVS